MNLTKYGIHFHAFFYYIAEVSDDVNENNISPIVYQATDVDFSMNPYADGKFKFNDKTLLDEINLGNKVTDKIEKSSIVHFALFCACVRACVRVEDQKDRLFLFPLTDARISSQYFSEKNSEKKETARNLV